MSSFVNQRTVVIEWGDCDPAGIVFYPRYFDMFNASTDALFAAAGYPFRRLVQDYGIIGYPMVKAGAEFLIPSTYGDAIVIESRVANWGRTSFCIEHTALKACKCAIKATEVRVWAERTTDGALRGREAPATIVQKMLGREPI